MTGGRGRMGRAFCSHALDQGHDVVSIDNRPISNAAFSDPSCSEVVADVTRYEELVKAVASTDAIVHLAAHPSPRGRPVQEVHDLNVVSNYHALCAGAELGITHLCLASSINATGAAFSRQPRYDYFPLDEKHPTYNEDPYSLSKWIGEAQADSVARRWQHLTISSLRLHHLVESRERLRDRMAQDSAQFRRELWGYTTFEAACRAIMSSLQVLWHGHEVFYVVAPHTAAGRATRDLCAEHYPTVPLIGELPAQTGLYDTAKAALLLGWKHDANLQQ